MAPHIRPARPDEAAALGAMCARAFFDDAGAIYTEPDPALRNAANGPVFAAIVADLAPAGLAFTTDDLDGVAAWERPPRDGVGGSVDPAVAEAIGPAAAERLRRMAAHFEQLRGLAGGRDTWHLALLGVAPERQGAGLGSALLRHGLELVDAAGAACYLETFPDRNVAFYRRFGFDVRAEARIPGSDVVVRGMVRDPARGGR
jgi:ribosomal protein S18 acetylase RimI-like enzyme